MENGERSEREVLGKGRRYRGFLRQRERDGGVEDSLRALAAAPMHIFVLHRHDLGPVGGPPKAQRPLPAGRSQNAVKLC